MASARSAWGIDIGNRALKAVKLVREGDQLRVDDFETIEHDTVLSSSGDNREGLIQTALTAFMQRHQLKGSAVAVAVSGQQSFARFIKLPPVEEKKIPEIVKFEAIQQIPFPLDDVEWTYQLFRNPESPDVEVGIFAMRKELLASHIKFFTDFDMNVQVVQLSPLAVYNAMYYDGRLRGTTMLIDLGAENTDLVIADENSIWLRTIPIGGNNFTDTLTKAFKLNFQKAEDLKRNAATSKYARQIFQAMRPVFADLVAEIQRSVGFYSSVHRDSRIKKCLAIGGTFKLPGLQKYLQQNLQLDVERLDSVTAAPPQDSKLAPNFNENLLSLVTAYGLAIQGMGEAKVESSLLPAKIRREKMWKEKTKWFAAAAALFCLGTGLAAGSWYIHQLRFQSKESVQREIDQIKGNGERLSTEWQAIADAGGPERQRIINVRSTEHYRGLWGSLLADIAAALPTPQKEVLDADVEVIKKVPRDERRRISIDQLSFVYQDNLQPILQGRLRDFSNLVGLQASAMTASGTGIGGIGTEFVNPNPTGDQPPADGTAPVDPNAPRGFVVLARVITPNKNSSELVRDTFAANLLKIGPTAAQPKVAYAIPKVEIVSRRKIADDPTRMGQMKTNYDQALRGQGLSSAVASSSGFNPGFSNDSGAFNPGASPFGQVGGFFNAGASGPVEDSAPYLDRRTGEDVRQDTILDVLFVVQIDPPAPAAAAPTASAGE